MLDRKMIGEQWEQTRHDLYMHTLFREECKIVPFGIPFSSPNKQPDFKLATTTNREEEKQ